MNERIIYDGNSLGYSAHQGAVLKSGDQETQAIIGVLRAIRSSYQKYPDASHLVLWDGRSWRKTVSDTYKAQRDATPALRESRRKYKEQKPYIVRGLRLLGVPQLVASNLEADDFAAKFSKAAVNRNEFVRLISGDNDWIQLVHEKCIWESHKNNALTKLVSAETFARETGFANPRQFVQAKALQGDISDNIKGVGMIGEKKAVELLTIWGTVENFFADQDPKKTYLAFHSGKPDAPKACPKAYLDFHTMEDRRAKYAENMRLMCLLDDLPDADRPSLDKGSLDEAGFRSFCQELGFVSIYQRPESLQYFIEPFKKDKQ